MVNDHDSCDHPVPKHKAWVDAVAVIARTGFFVLCSVFKEHWTEKARPELGALCTGPPAATLWVVRLGPFCSGLYFARRSCSPERRATLAGPPRGCNSGAEGLSVKLRGRAVRAASGGTHLDRSDRLWWRKREVSRPFTLVQPSGEWLPSLPARRFCQEQFFGAEPTYRVWTGTQFGWSERRQTPDR
jgi:hypothetical protein